MGAEHGLPRPSRSKAVRANPIIFETGISQDFVDADRVKKDCSTNASIERSLFSLIHLLLAKPALEAFCEQVRQDKKNCFERGLTASEEAVTARPLNFI
ncbi:MULTISPECIES: hypothetical protein [unclassified Microcoleus]|uniref:hypothetical protein n=1 Tax=unclassified Microcoleus TaxID=2642155 RepID=UPI002FD748F2